jgi:hypothetical protein
MRSNWASRSVGPDLVVAAEQVVAKQPQADGLSGSDTKHKGAKCRKRKAGLGPPFHIA